MVDARADMMTKPAETDALKAPLAQILFDPLSYLHPQRLRLSPSLDTPRQRAIVNRLLLADAPHLPPAITAHSLKLLPHWRRLPYICSLVGAQLLKSELAWCGRCLHLPAPVQFFMSLSLPRTVVVQDDVAASADWRTDGDPQRQVLRVGLLRILDWQRLAPAALLARMRLLFSSQLDACFDGPREPLPASELFLISQAIQYAQNHPYHM